MVLFVSNVKDKPIWRYLDIFDECLINIFLVIVHITWIMSIPNYVRFPQDLPLIIIVKSTTYNVEYTITFGNINKGFIVSYWGWYSLLNVRYTTDDWQLLRYVECRCRLILKLRAMRQWRWSEHSWIFGWVNFISSEFTCDWLKTRNSANRREANKLWGYDVIIENLISKIDKEKLLMFNLTIL